MAYDNDKSGVLFKNDKEGNEARPDYKGSIQINGVEYWLSAWIKEGKKGKFISLKAEEKKKAAAAMPKEKSDFIDYDIPF